MSKINFQKQSKFMFEVNFIERKADGRPCLKSNQVVRRKIGSDSAAKIAYDFESKGGIIR